MELVFLPYGQKLDIIEQCFDLQARMHILKRICRVQLEKKHNHWKVLTFTEVTRKDREMYLNVFGKDVACGLYFLMRPQTEDELNMDEDQFWVLEPEFDKPADELITSHKLLTYAHN
jgi:hypothetical protein